MKLKSFGCSFIFGSELKDDGYSSPRATPSNFTWPALLAKHLGLEYQCFAKPGCGNTRIAEQVLNQIASGEPAFYVVGWTWIERFDFVNRNQNDRWQTITPWNEDTVAKNYYRDMHSQYLDKLQSLIDAGLVLNQLKKTQSQFFMTYMDELMFEIQFHHSAAMHLLQQELKPHCNNFEGVNFLEWSRINGFPIGTRGKHPLEQAHASACEYLIKNHNFL